MSLKVYCRTLCCSEAAIQSIIYRGTRMFQWWILDVRHCGQSGIGSRLGRNRLWVRLLAVSDIYPMFIEPTITWVPSGFSGYIWHDTKIVFKKKNTCLFIFYKYPQIIECPSNRASVLESSSLKRKSQVSRSQPWRSRSQSRLTEPHRVHE